MKENEENKQPEYLSVPIPREFYSFDKKPFDHCICCDTELIQNRKMYMVERVMKKDDVIIEYAICMECAEEKNNTMSEESREAIEEYMMSHINPGKRVMSMLQKFKMDYKGWISKCFATEQPIEEMEDYSLAGHFVGDRMVLGVYPLMFSKEARMEMSELLSQKTKDEMNGFIDDNFGLPPELKKLMRERDIVLM